MAHIELHNVSVQFPIYNVSTRSLKKNFLRLATGGAVNEDMKQRVLVSALQNITLSLTNGDRVGIIGHNGSGKSTLLRLLAQIYEPTSGVFHLEGRVCSLLDIMQGVEAEFTGLENITIRGTMLGLSKHEIKQKTAEVAEFSGLGEYLSLPLRTYSSGMRVRLGFAMSTCVQPDILLIDEVFGAGDSAFMERAQQKMADLLTQSSIVVMATHVDGLIQQFCNKALWLQSGQIQFFGETSETLQYYHDNQYAKI